MAEIDLDMLSALGEELDDRTESLVADLNNWVLSHGAKHPDARLIRDVIIFIGHNQTYMEALTQHLDNASTIIRDLKEKLKNV